MTAPAKPKQMSQFFSLYNSFLEVFTSSLYSVISITRPPLKIPTVSAVHRSHLINLDRIGRPWIPASRLEIRTGLAVRGSLFLILTNLAVHGSLQPLLKIRIASGVRGSLRLTL